MKKYFLLFAAGGLLTLASCGGETKPTEINVDSIAAVKADSIAMALQAQTDSTIAAQSMAKADSLTAVLKADSIAAAIKAKSTGKKVNSKPTTTKPSTPTTPVVPTNPKTDKMNGNTNTVEEKKDKMSGNTQTNVEEKKSKMKGK